MSDWAFPSFPLHALPNIPNYYTIPESQISEQGQPQLRSTNQSNSSGNTSSRRQPNAEECYEGDQDDDDDDPRNAVPKARVRRVKSPEQNLLHTMIRLFLQERGHFLGREAMAEGKILLGPNVAIVDAYMGRFGPGPSNEDPRFAWECPVSHPWNQMVIRILATSFKTYATTTGIGHLVKLLGAGAGAGGAIKDYSVRLDKIADIQAVIGDKLADQQRRYRTVMRQVGSLSGLSELEIKETLKGNLRTSQTSSRRSERKRNRYLRRATIINEQLFLAASSPAKTELWQALELIFAHLKEEDMSSDDTETEGSFFAGKVVRRVRKLWISDEVTKILHFVDGNYSPRTIGGSRKRGSGPLKRELASLRCNALHAPPPHLPVNFYNPELGEERIETLGPKPLMEFPELKIRSSNAIPDEMDAS